MNSHSRLCTAIVLGAFCLSVQGTLAADPKFRKPLNTSMSPTVNYHYDHDTTSKVKNYQCGTSSVYNGHQGIDFKANYNDAIYAGAAGGLYYRFDSCDTDGYLGSTCGGGFGNHVRIDHEGDTQDGKGWLTIYAHMTKGTAAWYQSLKCGTKIGAVGNSGNSQGKHLHFEVRKYSYPNNDPFSGQCSGATSFWVNQNNGSPTTSCQ